MGLWITIKSNMKKRAEHERKLAREDKAYRQILAKQLRAEKRRAFVKEMKKQVRKQMQRRVKAQFSEPKVVKPQVSTTHVDKVLKKNKQDEEFAKRYFGGY